MIETDIAILGGGLSGLSTAYFLKKNRHKDYLVFEKEKETGGLCRSKNINGFIFDYDGHLLHFRNKNIQNLIKGLLADNLIHHHRNSWVKADGYEIPYPFQNFFLHTRPQIARPCLIDFIKSNSAPKKINNFREWSLSNFGRGVSEHFMFPYNRKFWGLNPVELSCEWIAGFVPVPKLDEILQAFSDINTDSIGYNSSFWYPRKGGINSLVSVMNKVNDEKLYCSFTAKEINIKEKTILFGNNEKIKFNCLVSSIPLPEFLRIIPSLPAKIKSALKKLRHNSIFVLNLGIDRPDISAKHWVYFPDKNIIFYRVGFPMNFSPNAAPSGKSSLYAEVSYSKDKPINKQILKKRIIRDLVKAKILTKNEKIETEDIVDIKYGYPIYDRNYKEATRIILDFFASYNIFCIGRYGKWKYMSMEDTILDAQNTVELLRFKHD